MKRFIYIFQCLILTALLSSCVYSKDSYIDSFETFVEVLEEKSKITLDELPTIENYYSEYTATYFEKYKDRLSANDLKKVIELEVRYRASLTKVEFGKNEQTIRNIESKAKSAFDTIFD